MIIIAARFIVIFFGLFIISIGFLMLFKPLKARETLRKAGSTALINYGEISLRLIPATALILISEHSKFPLFFQLFGWCMLITSLVLYFISMKIHHAFSTKSADVLKPLYFQFIAPFAFLLGGFLIYCVV